VSETVPGTGQAEDAPAHENHRIIPHPPAARSCCPVDRSIVAATQTEVAPAGTVMSSGQCHGLEEASRHIGVRGPVQIGAQGGRAALESVTRGGRDISGQPLELLGTERIDDKRRPCD
jgi:hypothetical protein